MDMVINKCITYNYYYKINEEVMMSSKGNGISVKVFNNDVDGALKQLKRKIKNSNLIVELQRCEFYKKPSEIRREKRHKSKRRKNLSD